MSDEKAAHAPVPAPDPAPGPFVLCQPRLAADGTLLVRYRVHVRGPHQYRVAGAILAGPDGEMPLVESGTPEVWMARSPEGRVSDSPVVSGLLVGPVPRTGGQMSIKVPGLAPLRDGAPPPPAGGPWVFSFVLAPEAVADWHSAMPFERSTPLPGGVELRLNRLLRSAERTVLWQELCWPEPPDAIVVCGVSPEWRLLLREQSHVWGVIDCQGLRYTGIPHRAARPDLQPLPPYAPYAKPGEPGGPPLQCPIDATVFAPLPAGAAACLSYQSLSYPATSPWALRFEVPADRPAIWSGPVVCQVAGVEVRLEEASLSPRSTIMFLTTGILKTDGFTVNGSIASPTLIEAGGRVYPTSSGSSGSTSSLLIGPSLPPGETELTLMGQSIMLNVKADGRALSFELPA